MRCNRCGNQMEEETGSGNVADFFCNPKDDGCGNSQRAFREQGQKPQDTEEVD